MMMENGENVMKMQKKFFLKILIFVLVLFLGGMCIYLIDGYTSKDDYFVNITFDEIDSTLSARNELILIIGREKCPYCEELIKKVKNDILEKKKYVYYYEMAHDDILKKKELIAKFGEFEFVPHVLYFQDGEIVKVKKSEEAKDIYENFWSFS